MTEAEFRAKYPHSTDDQVRLYLAAVRAEAANPPPKFAENRQNSPPLELMPVITVPIRTVTTYDAVRFTAPHFVEAPPDFEWTGDISDDDLARLFDPKEYEMRSSVE